MIKNLRRKGFALAELAIIVAIVAILAAILIPTLSGVFKNTTGTETTIWPLILVKMAIGGLEM